MPPDAGHKIPTGWRRVRLGDICEITAKQVDPRIEEFAALPHVNGTSIESGTCRLLHLEAASGAGLISGKYLFDSGDVLYSKLRPYLRKVVVAETRGVCSADMYPIRVTREMVDPRFLAWLLVTDEFTRYANEESARARMPKLNREQLFAWETALPPIGEQHRILVVLEGQMAVAERARVAAEARLDAAKILPDAYLRHAFYGRTPLSVGDGRAVFPRNWIWRLLTSCARLESGHTPSRYHPEWWGGETPWISLTDIRELDGKIARQTREYTNEEGIANSAARVLPAGTVVLSRTASVGFVTIMGREMATSQDFVNWVCGRDLDPHFLAYLLRTSRAHLRRLSSGAIHQTIYMPTVETFEVCIPDLKEQQRIAGVLDEQMAVADRARDAAASQLSEISTLPAALLRRAFSGEL